MVAFNPKISSLIAIAIFLANSLFVNLVGFKTSSIKLSLFIFFGRMGFPFIKLSLPACFAITYFAKTDASKLLLCKTALLKARDIV